MEYREEYDGSYLIRLHKGDEIISSLISLADEFGLCGATFDGIGAVDKAEIGYFDTEMKDYVRVEIFDQRELLSLKGNIGSGPDEKLIVHAHVILGDRNMTVIGGHLFSGRVSVTVEIRLFPSDDIRREPDSETGLNLWELNR